MHVTVGGWAWLPKSNLTLAQLRRMQQILTLMPRKQHPKDEPQPLHLYQNSGAHIGVPREFFLQNQTQDNVIRWAITEGDKSSWPGEEGMEFVGKLREGQQTALDNVMASFERGRLGGIVRAPTGWGKSPRVGTEIVMYDGTLRKVEELVPGDRVMGPDSTPRTILSTGRGVGPMYRITPTKGDAWECNGDHILTLVRTDTGEVRDIPLQEYLGFSKTQKHLWKQFAPPTGVDFPSAASLPLDPYFLGVWYGDGTKALNGVSITKNDAEIRALCEDTAKRWGLRVRSEKRSSASYTYHLVLKEGGGANPLLTLLRGIVGDGERLPHAYLTASRENRFQFLAGLLDTDGHNNGGVLRITQKRKGWIEDIAFLARSLGFKVVVPSKPKMVKGVAYWRANISGDFAEVPFRLARKNPGPRRQKKTATRTGFKVEAVGEGEWAGIVLDGDHRYLLGDFTVTHNTVFACAVMAALKVPTLVTVHNTMLLDQWLVRIKHGEPGMPPFLPHAEVGIIQGPTCDIEGKHIVLAMVQTLTQKLYPKEIYNWPGLLISDECHRVGAPTWSKIPPMFPARFRLGLSATPHRADGLENVFYWHLGPMLHAANQLQLQPVVKRVWTDFTVARSNQLPKASAEAIMLRYMMRNPVRNGVIINQLKRALLAGRQVILMSKRLKHLDILEQMFKEQWDVETDGPLPVIGRCVGGISTDELQQVKATADVIFSTYQYTKEGFDVARLDTIILAMPASNVEQAIGRILRLYEGKKPPIVVDIRDNRVGLFKRWGDKRDELYDRLCA